MATKDALGDRMKNYYEGRYRFYLPRRIPVVIRLDGKSFHTFTKNFKRPYDEVLHEAMNKTLQYLCKNIQGCKFGYTQSDEITLLLTDYDTLSTDAWFDYALQKVTSVAASMATLMFNKYFEEALMKENSKFTTEFIDYEKHEFNPYYKNSELTELWYTHKRAHEKGALFDARCFTIPVEEVVNCFVWRQQDATRNAIQILGQCNFSTKELHGRSCNDIQDMLLTQRGINFNDMPTEFKRGVCCYKVTTPCLTRKIGYKTEWVIDTECPIFTQNRNYIEKHLYTSNEENR